MNKRAFATALRAAAKITFGTSLLGCGVSIDVDELDSDEPEETRPIDEEQEEADGIEMTDDALQRTVLGTPDPVVPVCEGPIAEPEDWAVFDEQTFACCTESLSASLPESFEKSGFGFDPAPEIGNCCTQIVSENYEAIWNGQALPHPAPQDVITACCITRHGNSACTPWGPPVPPTMDPGDYVPWMFMAAETRPRVFEAAAGDVRTSMAMGVA